MEEPNQNVDANVETFWNFFFPKLGKLLRGSQPLIPSHPTYLYFSIYMYACLHDHIQNVYKQIVLCQTCSWFSAENMAFSEAQFFCFSARALVWASRISLNSDSVFTSSNFIRSSGSDMMVAKVRPVSNSFFVPFCPHKRKTNWNYIEN